MSPPGTVVLVPAQPQGGGWVHVDTFPGPPEHPIPAFAFQLGRLVVMSSFSIGRGKAEYHLSVSTRRRAPTEEELAFVFRDFGIPPDARRQRGRDDRRVIHLFSPVPAHLLPPRRAP